MITLLKTYSLTPLIKAPKIPLDVLWGLSVLFVMLVAVYFIAVFFFRNRLSKKRNEVMAKRKVFSPMICEFLFYDINGEKKEQYTYIDLKIQIRELIKHPFDREVLTAVLLDLRKDVTGATRLEIFRVYKELDLHRDAYKKLKSWHWERVSKGIYELTQMQVKESYGHITSFINDKRPTIRKQSELAAVSLKEEGIIYFLDHTKYRISEWQQLKLLEVVRNRQDYSPPPFRLWLTSKNNHVVLFALRLIKYYNQNDASASLIALLRHKNNHIKKEAIFCLRDFNVAEAVPILKTIFWKCSEEVKMYILEALSHLGTDTDITFIETIITKEIAFNVKGKAISALNTIRPGRVLPTQDIVPKIDFEIRDAKSAKKYSNTAVIPNQTSTINYETAKIKKSPNQVNLAAASPIVKKEQEHTNDIMVSYEVIASSASQSIKNSLENKPSERTSLPILTGAISQTSEISRQNNSESIISSKKKIDIDAIKKIKVSYKVITGKKIRAATNSLEIQESELSFLPIVTDVISEIPKVSTSTSYEPRKVSKKETGPELIKNMEVSYELAAPKNVKSIKTFLEILPSELSFLPIVTSTVGKAPIAPAKKVSKKEERLLLIAGLEVNYTEVSSAYSKENLLLNFLPIVVNKQVPLQQLPNTTNTRELNKKDDKLQKAKESILWADFPVIYEQILPLELGQLVIDQEENNLKNKNPKQKEENLEAEPIFSAVIIEDERTDLLPKSDCKEIETNIKDKEITMEIDWSSSFEPKNKIPIVKRIIPKKLIEKLNPFRVKAKIPKPFFYKDETLKNIVLLEDIAELGDHREIPFLKILLEQENNTAVKNRIADLISSFSIIKKTVPYYKIPTTSKNQSMFHTLFEGSDTQVQLMLLREIEEVGDKQELSLLQALSLSDNNIIKKAATHTLEQLNEKLFKTTKQNEGIEAETEILKNAKPIKNTEEELFAIAFDVKLAKDKKPIIKDRPRNEVYGNTMFDHLCATTTKLYEKE